MSVSCKKKKSIPSVASSFFLLFLIISSSIDSLRQAVAAELFTIAFLFYKEKELSSLPQSFAWMCFSEQKRYGVKKMMQRKRRKRKEMCPLSLSLYFSMISLWNDIDFWYSNSFLFLSLTFLSALYFYVSLFLLSLLKFELQTIRFFTLFIPFLFLRKCDFSALLFRTKRYLDFWSTLTFFFRSFYCFSSISRLRESSEHKTQTFVCHCW